MFWEDNYLGPSSLVIQFWEIYVLVNEKTGTLAGMVETLNAPLGGGGHEYVG